MNDVNTDAMLRSLIYVRESTGYVFSFAEAQDIMKYSARKCERIGKDASYLPLLFQNELLDYVDRKRFNASQRMKFGQNAEIS